MFDSIVELIEMSENRKNVGKRGLVADSGGERMGTRTSDSWRNDGLILVRFSVYQVQEIVLISNYKRQ